MWSASFLLVIVLALTTEKICNILILLFLNTEEGVRNLTCPNCGNPLKWCFFIPLLPLLLKKCACSSCRKKFPTYMIINELLVPILVIALYIKFGLSIIFFQYILLTIMGTVVFFTDLFIRIIPDILTYPLIISAILFSFVNGIGFWGAIKGFILGAGSFVLIAFIFRLITKRQGLGSGDIKLISAIGLSLGFKLTFLTISLSSILGVIVYGFSRIRKEALIPFGSFIVIAMYVSMIAGKEIVDWYLGLWMST